MARHGRGGGICCGVVGAPRAGSAPGTLGGDSRLIAQEGRSPRFSPDGSRIAYWVGRMLGGSRVLGGRIFVVPANGGEPVELARGFATAKYPIWSPDGRSILFFGAKTTG